MSVICSFLVLLDLPDAYVVVNLYIYMYLCVSIISTYATSPLMDASFQESPIVIKRATRTIRERGLPQLESTVGKLCQAMSHTLTKTAQHPSLFRETLAGD
jgi:hypothetical protein